MREEHVIIASDGLKLEGLIARPLADRPGRAAVVCHPHPLYGGSMYNNVVEAALEALWKLGFATIRFNFRGVGMSTGRYSGGKGEAKDAAAAMRLLLEQDGVAAERAVMAGYSFGAEVAIRAGTAMKAVETIVAIALPVASDDFSFAKGAGKRIVMIAGENDPYCPRDAIAGLTKVLGPDARLKLIAGTDHFFAGAETELCSALVELIGAEQTA
jgi:uncharacterized protein